MTNNVGLTFSVSEIDINSGPLCKAGVNKVSVRNVHGPVSTEQARGPLEQYYSPSSTIDTLVASYKNKVLVTLYHGLQ